MAIALLLILLVVLALYGRSVLLQVRKSAQEFFIYVLLLFAISAIVVLYVSMT